MRLGTACAALVRVVVTSAKGTFGSLIDGKDVRDPCGANERKAGTTRTFIRLTSSDEPYYNKGYIKVCDRPDQFRLVEQRLAGARDARQDACETVRVAITNTRVPSYLQ